MYFSVLESVLTILLILGIYLYSLHLPNLLQIVGRYDGRLCHLRPGLFLHLPLMIMISETLCSISLILEVSNAVYNSSA
jgi:hypothetical protein